MEHPIFEKIKEYNNGPRNDGYEPIPDSCILNARKVFELIPEEESKKVPVAIDEEGKIQIYWPLENNKEHLLIACQDSIHAIKLLNEKIDKYVIFDIENLENCIKEWLGFLNNV